MRRLIVGLTVIGGAAFVALESIDERAAAFPVLLGAVPVGLIVLGLWLGNVPTMWFGLGALVMLSALLIFSVGLYYLPVALVLLFLLTWYQIDAGRRTPDRR